MTIEEAIFCEKSYIGETNCTDCKYYGTETCQSRESHRMAVKALKQGSVFNKIKAEINGLYRVILKGTPKDDWAVRWNDCLDNVLQIIDKYKSEGK